MDQHKKFSLHEFKGWLSKQQDLSDFFNISMTTNDEADTLTGKGVVAKVGVKKLIQRMQIEEGDQQTLAEDLVQNGGSILSLKGKYVLVEVESGSFYIPRFCVRTIED